MTREGSPTYVPPEARVAVFDNDGTLWSEQPIYFQYAYLVDRVRTAAPQHPEWKNNAAFKALMANDMAAAMANHQQLLQLLAAANSGMTVDEYDAMTREWLQDLYRLWRHHRFHASVERKGLRHSTRAGYRF